MSGPYFKLLFWKTQKQRLVLPTGPCASYDGELTAIQLHSIIESVNICNYTIVVPRAPNRAHLHNDSLDQHGSLASPCRLSLKGNANSVSLL
jgi:hypothetical protein